MTGPTFTRIRPEFEPALAADNDRFRRMLHYCEVAMLKAREAALYANERAFAAGPLAFLPEFPNEVEPIVAAIRLSSPWEGPSE